MKTLRIFCVTHFFGSWGKHSKRSRPKILRLRDARVGLHGFVELNNPHLGIDREHSDRDSLDDEPIELFGGDRVAHSEPREERVQMLAHGDDGRFRPEDQQVGDECLVLDAEIDLEKERRAPRKRRRVEHAIDAVSHANERGWRIGELLAELVADPAEARADQEIRDVEKELLLGGLVFAALVAGQLGELLEAGRAEEDEALSRCDARERLTDGRDGFVVAHHLPERGQHQRCLHEPHLRDRKIDEAVEQSGERITRAAHRDVDDSRATRRAGLR